MIAHLAAEHALAADSDYRLARLLDELNAASVHPQVIREALAQASRTHLPDHDPACPRPDTTRGGADG